MERARSGFDVCVVGGGLSGLCAACAAARRGAKVALVGDRPMLGGNASSEIRMWICGAHGDYNKEAGLLEELQLANCAANPSLNYSMWDDVLWSFAAFQPNLTLFLNASCFDAKTEDGHITEIEAWQTTTQIRHTIAAKLFIDCSGDSVLAPLVGARYRVGREAASEYGEDIEPPTADRKTLSSSILIQLRATDEPQPFTRPTWAVRFESKADLPNRLGDFRTDNYWWIEIGGVNDTIADAEQLRTTLTQLAYGVLDYVKNVSPQRDKAANYAVEWVGSLPGKRESRRYVGDHVLCQSEVSAGGAFDDIIAYGGWTMDDHHPAGIFYAGQPTIFHAAPSPFGIPYRSLYSLNVPNLMFAGRNISVTHAALSATRVMATCALEGQAAGTAAALCCAHSCLPRAFSSGAKLAELQSALMDDDCWLPGRARPIAELARSAWLGGSNHPATLLDGVDRNLAKANHLWTGPLGGAVEFRWDALRQIGGFRVTFDSDLTNLKRMPCSYPQKNVCRVPKTLAREFHIDAQDASGAWRTIHRETDNVRRLWHLPLAVEAKAIRLVVDSAWGANEARIFAAEPTATCPWPTPRVEQAPTFQELRKTVPAADLAAPNSEAARHGR